jgi:hypothetical protein
MNRCLKIFLPAMALLGAFAAPAQDFVRQFPAAAQRGEMRVLAPPDIRMNGKVDRLSPGARIRGTTNNFVMSGAIVNQPLTVNYVRDGAGLVHEVWILTEAEAKLKRPGQQSGRNFSFESEGDKPKVDDGKTPFDQLPKYKQQ